MCSSQQLKRLPPGPPNPPNNTHTLALVVSAHVRRIQVRPSRRRPPVSWTSSTSDGPGFGAAAPGGPDQGWKPLDNLKAGQPPPPLLQKLHFLWWSFSIIMKCSMNTISEEFRLTRADGPLSFWSWFFPHLVVTAGVNVPGRARNAVNRASTSSFKY